MIKWLIIFLLLLTTGCDKLIPSSWRGPTTVKGTPVTSKVVVMMAGQSNMLGIGQDESFPTSNAVRMVYVGGNPYWMRGPGASAGLDYVAAHPGTQFIGVMCAKGSTSINEWGPGSALLEACIDRVKQISQSENAPIIGMFWDQGEQDAFLNTLDWPQKLSALVAHTKTRLGLGHLPVVYAQIGQTDDTYNGQWGPFKSLQASVSDASFQMVRTDDLPAVGHVHHDYNANLEIGRRFAQAMTEWAL